MDQSNRRNFLKIGTPGGLGVISGNNLIKENAQTSRKADDIKLKIVCVGAHPGGLEFGCGGTLAKYSDAGHDITLVYLKRGEATDPDTTHDEMAKLQTAEALFS